MTRHSIGALTALFILVAAVLAVFAGQPGSSPTLVAAVSAKAPPGAAIGKGPLRLRYAMRVLGMKVGEPAVHMGPVSTSSAGVPIRTLRFQGGTWGKFRRLYPFDTSSVSVLDASSYRPIRTVINMLRGENKKTVDLRFKGDRVVGSVTKNGRVRTTDEVHDHGMVDTVTSLVWLAFRDLKPGESDQVPHHSGRKRYRLWVQAEGVEEVRVAAGTFEALKVVCTLYKWEHGLPAPKTQPADKPVTQWTAWMGRDPYRSPIKLVAKVSILGEVVVELEARRFK